MASTPLSSSREWGGLSCWCRPRGRLWEGDGSSPIETARQV
jgi:hypothetical protein